MERSKRLSQVSWWILLVFLTSGCARLTYFYEAGMGQLSLQNKAISNQKALEDVRITAENKEKIKKIQTYKKYFYEYFKRKPTPIYSQTTLLERDAVTYLVIASKYNKVEPRKECFLFLGCFPYLGFYSEQSAINYQAKLKADDFVTYRRPVYAYSTLGYFNDTILSSFFHYSGFELAELIFHELFHTIFFIKNEVDLNENLANYFGEEMALEYFDFDNEKRQKYRQAQAKIETLKSTMVSLIKKYKNDLEQKPISKTAAKKLLENFLRDQFKPAIRATCQSLDLSIKQCFPLKNTWNNASFAAFMTYESRGNEIAQLRKSKNLTLTEYITYIEKAYEAYQQNPGEFKKFEDYLLQ